MSGEANRDAGSSALLHLISVLSEPVKHGPAVLKTAHLAGDVHGCLVRIETEAELVVLDREDVRTRIGDDTEHLRETAGPVEQRDGKLHAPSAGDKTLLNDALDETHVYIAAGEHACDLFALRVYFPAQHGGERRRACRL